MPRSNLNLGHAMFSVLCVMFSTLAHGQETEALIQKWLDAQKNLETWSADFTQTRKLKTFAQPLTSEGHLWYRAPHQFRWELGKPAQTIAIRQKGEMLIIYPKLKRAELYPLTGSLPNQWKDALALLEAGFPKDRKDLDARFTIRNIQTTNGVCQLQLQPKSSQARRMMPQINIEFSVAGSELKATELHFTDGSIMRNDFKDGHTNAPVDEGLFTPSIPSEFKIVEPLKQK